MSPLEESTMADLSQNALTVLKRRYLAKDFNGQVAETAEEMFRRVAHHVAQADLNFDASRKEVKEIEDNFFAFMSQLDFLPNSPTLMNAGLELGQLSACFVLPVEDSMEGIFNAVKFAALIHKSGGGTGFSFSRLRPNGSPVGSTGGIASGVISFMKVFDVSTDIIKQGGRRRGANMGILRIDHPEILEFIKCKESNNELNNFNLSVALTEEFMRAVEEHRDYQLIDPRTKDVVATLNAGNVFRLIVDKAWLNGEPGIIFLDRINQDNPVAHIGEIESTNPCGEQPLLPYESCNLGSVNLNNHLILQEGTWILDEDKLFHTVQLAVHFLDNVIEVNKYPIDEVEEMTHKTRKIGLGVMGFADVLFKLGIPYNSERAVETAEEIMAVVNRVSKEASLTLAEKRGVFPSYIGSTWEAKNMPLRNATTTTIAPTGSISIIANTTSGIEPLFAVCYYRNVMDNDRLVEIHPYFKELAQARGFYSEELIERIAKEGTIQYIDEVPIDLKKIFVTSHDVSSTWHVRIQSAFQKHTDNAVSKTVNFNSDATREDIEAAYLLAYKSGCKGITVYRDGSRESQVLNLGKTPTQTKIVDKNTIYPRPRPRVTSGFTEKVKIGCGNLYVTVNYDNKGICEVFANLGRAGGCPSQSEATSRLCSVALRSGVNVEAVIEQLKGIRCHSTLIQKTKQKDVINVLSCPDAIGKVLKKVSNRIISEEKQQLIIQDIVMAVEAETDLDPTDELTRELTLTLPDYPPAWKDAACPECGANVEFEGGCVVCRSCGFSKCN
jgi:ribonucleoside-diphosphate reductase alpha chain